MRFRCRRIGNLPKKQVFMMRRGVKLFFSLVAAVTIWTLLLNNGQLSKISTPLLEPIPIA